MAGPIQRLGRPPFAPKGGGRAERTGDSRSPFRVGFAEALGAIVAIGLVLALAALSDVVFDVVAALFIALWLDPVVRRLARTGLSRARATLVVTMCFAIIAGTLLVFFVPFALRQAAALVRALPGSLTELSNEPWVRSVDAATGGGADAALGWIGEQVAQPSFWAHVAGGALALVRGALDVVASAWLITAVTICFLLSLKVIKRGFYSTVGASKRRTAIYLTERITGSIGRYLGGMVVLAVCNAVFSLILLTATRVPHAGAIALATLFITMIPLIGTAITTCFMTLFAFLSSPAAGWIVLMAMLVYMQNEAHVLAPKVFGKALRLPGAIVLVSATAGGALLGVAGAVAAIPVAAALALVLRYVVVPRRNAQ